MSGRLDPNQRPPEPHSGTDAAQVAIEKQDAATPPTVCTSVCTSEAKTGQTDSVAALAAALLGLSPEDRARLAAMLVSGKQE
jgi:hypothetical protein